MCSAMILYLHFLAQESLLEKVNYMFGTKKASVYLVVFFIVLALGIFYMVKTQTKFTIKTAEEQTAEQAYREYLGSYSELLKRYSTDALRYSATKATIDSVNVASTNRVALNVIPGKDGVPCKPITSKSK